MMKTSFSTLACPNWSLPQILHAAVNYGYSGVELRVVSNEVDLWRLPEFQASNLANARKEIEDHDVFISCVDTSACFHSPDAAERNTNLAVALRMAEIAAALGAHSIRVFGDSIQAGCSREETETWIAESLVQLAERLRPEKIEVWLETHGDFATAGNVSGILDQINDERIGVIWDPANAFAQLGERPVIVSGMSNRIRHVHLKDLRRNGQHIPDYVVTGQGEFPFETMFESLARINYEGFVSFEWERHWHTELAPPEFALPHFIEWWKRIGAH